MPVLKKPSSCDGCTLLTSPGPVFGEGNPDQVKLIYIAQNPGSAEVATLPMRPLVGPSGATFNHQLAEAGLSRSDIFITNQVKCLTPANREPTPLEISKCKCILDQELARCRADVVILSGAIAMKENIGGYSSLTPTYKPTASVFERMGCVEQRAGRKWIATIHPAFIMRMPEFREAGPTHLKKASALAKFELKKPVIRTHVTDAEVLEWVDKTILVTREFADDVETVGLEDVDEDDYVGGDWLMTMIGVANQPWEALVLDPRQTKLLAPVFQDPEIFRYEQNGEYDNYFIERYIDRATMANRKLDTMQATHRLRSHMPKKLKPFILSWYTWLPYYNRDLGKVDERLYNGMDLVTTFQAAKEQRRQLKHWKLEDIFFEFDMPLLPVLEEWRRKGVNVDVKRALLFKMITQEKIKRAEALIAKIGGTFFNPRSRNDLFRYFYETWKLPVQTKKDPKNPRGPEKPTMDYEARKRLRHWVEVSEERKEKFKLPLALLNLLDFNSGESKKLEYIGRISPDGRIHPYVKAHGTTSFRLASVPNYQNIPVYDISAWGGARRDDNETSDNPIEEPLDKDEERAVAAEGGKPKLGSLRSLIIPDHEDDWIVTYDIEQIQIWALAAQFNVKWLLEQFEKGEYLYGVIYEKLYKEPYFISGKPRTKQYRLPDISEQRIRRTKAVPLGFLFNRTAKAVAEEYGWPLSEGQALRDWWFGLCSELPAAYSKAEFTVKQVGYYRHAYGHVIYFPKKASDVVNSCAQTTEAMYIRQSIIMIDREIKARQAAGRMHSHTRTLLSVHDSISSNVHHSDILQFHNEIATPILGRPVPQLGDFKFRFSAEVSKMWDWDVMKISQWEAKYGGGHPQHA